MNLPLHLQFLLFGLLLGGVAALWLPALLRGLGRLLGRLLPSRHFRSHPRRLRRTARREETR